MIEPTATGASSETWRNSSRARIEEICTSTTGTETAETASRSATEVWVYPPALSTTPSTVPSACWMASISSPSMLDWKKENSTSGKTARSCAKYSPKVRVP